MDSSGSYLLGAPLKRLNLSQAVASRLQELIAEKKLHAGDRLPSERDLSVALQIGRPAVREGIRILEGLGIVEVRHGKGVFILEKQSQPLTDLSQLDSVQRAELLRKATQARRCIDVEAAREAAIAATDDDLVRIRTYLQEADQEPLRSKRQYSLDLGFEVHLGEATHSQYLITLQRTAHQMFISTWTSAGVIPRDADMRSDHHRAIFRAIEARDAKLAGDLMHEHFHLAID
jgi:GntR family transcriptional regulator, transcriptional repressor for pyruvate dehydrogenase complex